MKAFRIATVVLGALLLFTAGCTPNGKPKQAVAIIKYTTHPALDELEAGFLDALQSAKNSNPQLKNVEIEQYNANKNEQRAKELAEVVNRPDVKLIVAIATPAAQAVSRTPSKIPLLYGAVAAPKEAGIIPSERATGIQNAGPHIINEAVGFITNMLPHTKRIGSIYNPAEQNSVFVQKLIRDACTAAKVDFVQRTVADPAQVSSQTEALLLDGVDVLYSANDNTVNSAVASVVAIADVKKVPFVLGDLSTLSKGAFAAVGLEYKSMGRDLAGMAVEILTGTPVSQLPPRPAPSPEIWINEEIMKKLALSLPVSLQGKAKLQHY